MKYISEFALILGISFIGEVLHAIIDLPIPASIYGLVLMFICLCTHIIPQEAIKNTGRFLIEVMPMMFIPAAVGLLDSWSVLKPVLLPVGIITIVSTVVVMVSAGHITQAVIRHNDRKIKER